MTAPKLAVVIVNYNGWPDVVGLVAGLAEAPEVQDGRCEVLVVDNASDGPVPPEFAQGWPGVRLLCRPDNGGFAAGVNAGWRATTAPWLLLLNPDVVAGPDFLSRVLARLERLEHRPEGPPAVVGFGLRNADGTRQASVGAEPSLWRSLREPFIPRSRRKYQPGWRTRPGPVPWVTGACALVDGRLLEALGGMDEDFFLYYEEVALCRSAWDQGRRVEYDPSVEVIHLRPLQSRAIAPKLRVITRHSKLLYFRKHLPAWQFEGMTWLVALEARLRSLVARLRGRSEERSAWQTVGRLARAMRRGDPIRGRAVLAWAEAAVRLDAGSTPTGKLRAWARLRPRGRAPSSLRGGGEG
ncbi:MAG: glycosyltransferase family 2 protein [Isosphaeraceae bacterium]|nr:glycosyltransferase family 2 protein [Isosphaeraceae bacterium]